ncbi:MAG: hypothetical protein ACP5FK_12615 [bacterium]
MFHDKDYQLDENVQAHLICADTPWIKSAILSLINQHETITGCPTPSHGRMLYHE